MCLAFLDLQWFCRQIYPGVEEDDDATEEGCQAPTTPKNKMPPKVDPKKLEILFAIQLLRLKVAGYKAKSVRGMGDVVEGSVAFKEQRDFESPVNQSECLSAIIKGAVDEDCIFFTTQHPARMYRKFKRVYSIMYLIVLSVHCAMLGIKQSRTSVHHLYRY